MYGKSKSFTLFLILTGNYYYITEDVGNSNKIGLKNCFILQFYYF
jgi:hypothetical protein